MKAYKLILPLAVAAVVVGTAGCKEETKSASDQSATAVKQAGDAANQAATTVKAAGEQAAQRVADQAKAAAAPINEKAQALINSAKELVAGGKFADALAKLKEIGGEKLSAEQQTIVDALKAQIEKALAATSKSATDAAGAATGLLPKN